MQEVALIKEIFDTLERQFSGDELLQLKSIQLKIGKLTNVEPVLLTSALHAVAHAEKKFQNVSLSMEIIPVKILCQACGEYSVIENFVFNCRQCGTATHQIVEGEELLISHLEFS